MDYSFEEAEEVIISNRAVCLKCYDDIFSRHVHDFVTCSCGNLSVDGGQHYLRRLFEEEGQYKDLSIMISGDQLSHIVDRLEDAQERNCNNFGIICAILIGCKDAELLKEKNDE